MFHIELPKHDLQLAEVGCEKLIDIGPEMVKIWILSTLAKHEFKSHLYIFVWEKWMVMRGLEMEATEEATSDQMTLP